MDLDSLFQGSISVSGHAMFLSRPTAACAQHILDLSKRAMMGLQPSDTPGLALNGDRGTGKTSLLSALKSTVIPRAFHGKVVVISSDQNDPRETLGGRFPNINAKDRVENILMAINTHLERNQQALVILVDRDGHSHPSWKDLAVRLLPTLPSPRRVIGVVCANVPLEPIRLSPLDQNDTRLYLESRSSGVSVDQHDMYFKTGGNFQRVDAELDGVLDLVDFTTAEQTKWHQALSPLLRQALLLVDHPDLMMTIPAKLLCSNTTTTLSDLAQAADLGCIRFDPINEEVGFTSPREAAAALRDPLGCSSTFA